MPKHLPLALLDLLYTAGDRRSAARARFPPSNAAATTFMVCNANTWSFLDLRLSPHSSRFPSAQGPSIYHRRSPEHAVVEKSTLRCRPVPTVSPHPQNIAGRYPLCFLPVFDRTSSSVDPCRAASERATVPPGARASHGDRVLPQHHIMGPVSRF
jgi:hypothetical protein